MPFHNFLHDKEAESEAGPRTLARLRSQTRDRDHRLKNDLDHFRRNLRTEIRDAKDHFVALVDRLKCDWQLAITVLYGVVKQDSR